MNKCNYNNSLDTTKHMFIIVKSLTNQEQLILELLEMLDFLNQFLNTYLATSIIKMIITTCVDRGTFDYQLQKKT